MLAPRAWLEQERARGSRALTKGARKDLSVACCSGASLILGVFDKNRVPAGLGIEDFHGRLEVLGIRTAKSGDDGAQLNPVFFPALEKEVEEDGLPRRDRLHVSTYHGAGPVEKHHLDLDRTYIRVANVDRVDPGDLTGGAAKHAASQVRFRAGLSRSGCAKREDCEQRERRPELFDFGLWFHFMVSFIWCVRGVSSVVFLSPKAELGLRTHHDCSKYLAERWLRRNRSCGSG